MALREYLAQALPDQEQFEILHLQNPSKESHPVITPQSSNKSGLITVKNQHFFALFHKEKAIYALEIYVYITLTPEVQDTIAERIVFVSKADTNGYCDCEVSFKKITQQLLRYVLSINPNYYLQKVIPRHREYHKFDKHLITKKTKPTDALRLLAKRQGDVSLMSSINLNVGIYHSFQCQPNIITKICLFTKPSPQYLFAESSKNPKKHQLDGASLLKWWLDILDELIVECFDQNTTANLRIPGEDEPVVNRYLRGLKHNGWEAGDLFTKKSNEKHDLAAFRIPLFPDDPKSRFLHQLADEGRILSMYLKAYWAELQERQEFRLSVTVSVIGIQGHQAEEPIYVPNNKHDVFLTSSKKQFNSIKNYITGEAYDTIEGAFEAYLNVKYFLGDRFGRRLIKVEGVAKYRWIKKESIEKRRQDIINTLSVRKKPKK